MSSLFPCPTRHGQEPYRVAVLHGGPGALGEMAPVARVLSRKWGVLEPSQTADPLAAQVEELAEGIKTAGTPPLTVIGFSFGAWMGCLLASRHPDLVRRLILVSCPPFEERHAAAISRTRLDRLPATEREETRSLLAIGDDLDDDGLARLGCLLAKADAFDLAPADPSEPPVVCRVEVFAKVWPEAAALRRSGALLHETACLRCPVLAIHGEHDPHPVDGVREPLSRLLKDFSCVVLPRCGHVPWRERQARDLFYRLLLAALSEG